MKNWKTILAIDFDGNAADTYRSNFPDVEVRCASVADELDRLTYADVITGGFPCQPHSVAGKRKASADKRDGGHDFVEAIRRVKPRMFLGENVPGILTSENQEYVRRLVRAMQDAGYVIEVRCLDAVNFGVPQFRNRCWFWGIRQDLFDAGMRHRWPSPTHCWPPLEPGLFGEHYGLLPGVTVGKALNIWYPGCGWDADDHGTANPSAPCPTIKAGGNTDATGKQGGGCPPVVHEYRWSDAMLAKHPPASPASPASPVMAKYSKGGAEGLLLIADNESHQPHQPHQPANTLSSGGNGHGMSAANMCVTVDTKQKRTSTPASTPASTLGSDSRHSLRTKKKLVRRLTPEECMRLQSAPDDFRWPEGISKTAKYRIAGNGWNCRMGAVFAEYFHLVDPESQTVIDLFCGGGLGACGWHGRFWSYHSLAEAHFSESA